jgi:hypothetical protein
MKKILLITASFFVLACGEKVSTDTVQLSKDFMKALITMDEKTIEKIKHPKDGGRLNTERNLKPTQKYLLEHDISVSELKYTPQKGLTDNIECVVVQSNGTREGNANLPLIHWRLKFFEAKNKEGLYLKSIDKAYGHFKDKRCKR